MSWIYALGGQCRGILAFALVVAFVAIVSRALAGRGTVHPDFGHGERCGCPGCRKADEDDRRAV